MSKLFVNTIHSKTGAAEAINIQSDGDVEVVGNLVVPKRIHVRAVPSGATSYANLSAGSPLPMSVIQEDGDGNAASYYDTGAGVFTAPVSGVYYTAFAVMIQSATNGDFRLMKNGSLYQRFYHSSQRGWHGSTTVLLNANETLGFVQATNSTDIYQANFYSFVAFTHLF